MHLGSFSSARLAAWAQTRGATPDAARALARVLVARHAGRETDARASKKLLAQADATFDQSLPIIEPSPAADGTLRYAARLHDGQIVETVAIAHPERTTVCLSTQAGCARGCVFCETGRLGLARQLDASEITGQLAAVSRHLAALGRPPPSNVVFMGMGEPLDNLDEVLTACDVLTDRLGFGLAPRRLTISTVGVVPKMRELHRRSNVQLAVSLHAANDEARRRLLPVAKLWSLAELRDAIAESPRTVLVQWTLIDGVNDDDRSADELFAFCAGLDVRVNLIPLNPGPETTLVAPSWDRVRAFQKRLADRGVRTLVRMPHGQEVGGACGQLAGARRGEARAVLPVIGRSRG